MLRVAKEDLELGYPKELVALYAEAGWQMDRCRKFSSIMRADSDGELLRMLADGGFNPYQMQLLANYYEKGVPVAQLRDMGARNLTAYDMEQALKLVYQANREAETEKAGESLEERDRFYRQNQTLMEEKSQLIADLEEIQKEKDGVEQRLKEMESRALAEAEGSRAAGTKEVEVQQAAEEQQTAGRQTASGGQGINAGDSAGNDYLAAIRGRNGEKHLIPVERTV